MTEAVVTKEQMTVLEQIRIGRTTYDFITDNMNLTCPELNNIVEDMILKGLIEREGLMWHKLLTLKLTDKGRSLLPKLPAEEEELVSKYRLSKQDLKGLNLVSRLGRAGYDSFVKEMKELSYGYIISMVAYMGEKRFLNQHGLFRRTVSISDKGRQVLKEYEKLLK